MRKNKGLFFAVAILLAVTCLFISCSAEVSENAGGGDKLVYATFDNGSKAAINPHVTISYDLIDLNQAYWIYTATKNDGGGKTGEGTFAVSSTLEKGLSGTIGPFSVGSWTFSVAGYKTKSTSAPTSGTYVQIVVGGTTYYLSEQVFAGTNASVSLTTGTESAPAPIDMTVNLVTDGNGQLVLDKNFKFAWDGTGGATELKMKITGIATIVNPITLTKSSEGYYTFGSEDLVYNVAAGDYNLDFEISYAYNDVKYVVATVSNIAVKVYGGQTTRIDAAVLEGNFVYATINASLKSTATTTTVVDTAPTTFVTSYTPASVKSGSVSATEVTTVEFPAEALKATGSTVTEGYSVTSYELDVTVTDIDASQESTFVVEDLSEENVVASIDLTLTMIETSSTSATKSTPVSQFEGSSVVAVTTYIAKNLTEPVVYYNGVPFTEATTGAAGTYNYEGTSGKLVIYTDHFSEFYVSSKDEAYNATTGIAYAKVKGAVDAAVANQTIKLLKSCTSTDEALVFDESGVVFDLNGKTLTVVRTGSTKSIQVTSDVTIKNGAIVGALPTNTNSYVAVYVLAGGDLTLENVDITVNKNGNDESQYAVAVLASDAKLAIKDGEFNGLVGTNGQYRNDTLSISGGTFNEDVYFPAHGTYTISGGTFNKAVEIKSGSLTVSGGKFNYADDPQVYTPYWNGTTVTGCSLAAVAYNGGMEGTNYGPSPSVTITGGTFAGKIGLARSACSIDYPTINDTSETVIYLGENHVFYDDGTGEVEHCINTGCNAERKDGDDYVIVAKIGETEYKTLRAAINDATGETTITLFADDAILGNSGWAIANGKNITLDLNGHTLKNGIEDETTSYVIKNDGTLTITDSSIIGNGLITNGFHQNVLAGEWWSEPQRNFASNVITNCGTLTINTGTIRQTAQGSICYAIDNNSTDRDTTTTINGGLVCDVAGTAMRMFCNSTTNENKLIIIGGEISTPGYTAFWIQLPGSDSTKKPKATLEISGGKISGGEYAFYDYSFGNGFDNVSYEISGGTFEGWIWSYKDHDFIMGGTYTEDPSDYVVSEAGYVAEQDSQGIWTVKQIITGTGCSVHDDGNEF